MVTVCAWVWTALDELDLNRLDLDGFDVVNGLGYFGILGIKLFY